MTKQKGLCFHVEECFHTARKDSSVFLVPIINQPNQFRIVSSSEEESICNSTDKPCARASYSTNIPERPQLSGFILSECERCPIYEPAIFVYKTESFNEVDANLIQARDIQLIEHKGLKKLGLNAYSH
jgi:hypothetical protein